MEGKAEGTQRNDFNTDADVAARLDAIEKLTSVFGFDARTAARAVEAIDNKTDITAAYNWILDHGGEDRGGPIVPIHDCPHLDQHVKVTPEILRINEKCDHYEAVVGGDNNKNPDETGFEGDTSVAVKSDRSSTSSSVLQCPSTENWICLECNVSRCSRYVNGHSLYHARSTGHCLAVSWNDLSVWCYECEGYVTHLSLQPILTKLEELKFSF
jgi:uncharacterized UBP type Zn finger protein